MRQMICPFKGNRRRQCYAYAYFCAEVAKSVDAVDLESTDEIVVRVRVPSSAPPFYQNESFNNSLASRYRIIDP